MNFSHFLQPQGYHKELIRNLDFRDRLDILLEVRFSCVAKGKKEMLINFNFRGIENV